jgi:hypothetical protein
MVAHVVMLCAYDQEQMTSLLPRCIDALMRDYHWKDAAHHQYTERVMLIHPCHPWFHKRLRRGLRTDGQRIVLVVDSLDKFDWALLHDEGVMCVDIYTCFKKILMCAHTRYKNGKYLMEEREFINDLDYFLNADDDPQPTSNARS